MSRGKTVNEPERGVNTGSVAFGFLNSNALLLERVNVFFRSIITMRFCSNTTYKLIDIGPSRSWRMPIILSDLRLYRRQEYKTSNGNTTILETIEISAFTDGKRSDFATEKRLETIEISAFTDGKRSDFATDRPITSIYRKVVLLSC